MGGALDGIGWSVRDAWHRLSKKSCESDFILSKLNEALALIRATCTKEAKQFLILSVSQKIVLGRVLGAVFPWLFQVGVLLWDVSLGFLDCECLCSSAWL